MPLSPLKKTETRLLTDSHHQQTYNLPPYPNGWYMMLTSQDLKKGAVKPLSYFGRELVAFRGDDGIAHILNAFCPHYGAHLGFQSQVIGNKIECPFHGWQFNGEGKCQHVPHSSKVPNIGVREWPTQEKDGFIYLYFHSKNELPTYDIPHVAETKGGKGWRKLHEISNTLRSHVQELRENIVDESHFHFIHQQPTPPEQTFITNGPLATMSQPGHWGPIKADFIADMIGPGVMIVRVTGSINMYSLAFTTPINEHHAELRWFGAVQNPAHPLPFVGWLFERIFMHRARKEVAIEDVIWEHKTYIDHPIFQPHEKGIRKLREWYKQFYDEENIIIKQSDAA